MSVSATEAERPEGLTSPLRLDAGKSETAREEDDDDEYENIREQRLPFRSDDEYAESLNETQRDSCNSGAKDVTDAGQNCRDDGEYQQMLQRRGWKQSRLRSEYRYMPAVMSTAAMEIETP